MSTVFWAALADTRLPLKLEWSLIGIVSFFELLADARESVPMPIFLLQAQAALDISKA